VGGLPLVCISPKKFIDLLNGVVEQAEQAAEKRPCSVILSEAKNLSSI
jgi:hypothetical protein